MPGEESHWSPKTVDEETSPEAETSLPCSPGQAKVASVEASAAGTSTPTFHSFATPKTTTTSQ